MTTKEKNIHAQAMSKLRTDKLTPERRSEIARNAGKASGVSRKKISTDKANNELAQVKE